MGIYKFKYFLTFCAFVLLSLNTCAAQDPGFYFYEGLKKNSEGDKAEAIVLFEKSLDSKNIFISSAAAAELMELKFSGTEI